MKPPFRTQHAALILALLSSMLHAQTSEPTAVQSPAFAIERFEVLGNRLLPVSEIDAALTAHAGPGRSFADVQKAVETLEGLYRRRGYSTVYVAVPEQELEKGVVRLRVVEGRIAKVIVEGNEHFDTGNIRASLPQLIEGEAPVATRLSENIQLANENPAKQAEIILGVGDEEGEVNARVSVRDSKPWSLAASLDNTGTEATGQQRLGVSFQHNNLFNADHSASVSYMTSPDKPSGVDVDVYSLGYRLPLYAFGDSIEFLYANSTVGVPSSSPSLAGGLGIVGKGQIYSARYNLLLPRQGEYTSRLTLAIDERDMESACTIGGSKLTGVAGCEDYRVRPLSLTYSGRLEQTERAIAYAVGFAHNIAGSSSNAYRLAASNRDASTSFSVLRANGTLLQVLPADFQLRIASQAQIASGALIPTEQIGLAGSQAVRGFVERAVAMDQGYFVQSEIYTPDLAALASAPGSLRALAFFDLARGNSHDVGAQRASASISSAGLGLRYNYDKNFSWRFDLARIIDSHSVSATADPLDSGWRGHFSVTVAY